MLRTTISRLLVLAGSVASGLVLVPAAEATTGGTPCLQPGVTVGITSPVNPTAVSAGQPVDYSYRFCQTAAGDHYTIQVVQVSNVGSTEMDTAVTAPTVYPLHGSSGEIEASGSYTPRTGGHYQILVTYYATGGYTECAGAAFAVQAAAAVAIAPLPVPPVPVSASAPPAPAPAPAPVPAAPAPAPVPAAPAPAPVPAAPSPSRAASAAPARRAKLRLVKTAASSVLTKGQTAAFTLKTTDRAKVSARKVTICDNVPAGLVYLSASRKVSFRGAAACFAVGTLAAGKSASIDIRFTVEKSNGRIVNHATATAVNAPTVRAQATVGVHGPVSVTPAPVTG
ncbi:MAG: hypothetical protein QOF83_1327 [Solirubrobacteraceae bacterium]|nr:hypothetical protein [Solirubrobacteraceae bacterium]